MTRQQYNDNIRAKYLAEGWGAVQIVQWGDLPRCATLRSGARVLLGGFGPEEKRDYVLVYVKATGGRWGRSSQTRYRPIGGAS